MLSVCYGQTWAMRETKKNLSSDCVIGGIRLPYSPLKKKTTYLYVRNNRLVLHVLCKFQMFMHQLHSQNDYQHYDIVTYTT